MYSVYVSYLCLKFHVLFSWRLEKVAKKLSLSLTQIIVQSCCTNIPSKLLLKQGMKRSLIIGNCNRLCQIILWHKENFQEQLCWFFSLQNQMKKVLRSCGKAGCICPLMAQRQLWEMFWLDLCILWKKSLQKIIPREFLTLPVPNF